MFKSNSVVQIHHKLSILLALGQSRVDFRGVGLLMVLNGDSDDYFLWRAPHNRFILCPHTWRSIIRGNLGTITIFRGGSHTIGFWWLSFHTIITGCTPALQHATPSRFLLGMTTTTVHYNNSSWGFRQLFFSIFRGGKLLSVGSQ